MRHSALLTDFYQMTMAYSYWQAGMHDQEAVFHLFFRRNPNTGHYVIAAGLESVITFLKTFQFEEEDIAYLASLREPVFSADFLAYLKTLRFTGDIDAVPEGSVVFAHEPLLRIRAPLLLCQLLETPLINALNFASTVASMASRLRWIGKQDALFEFGLRRAQGPNGGLTASRSAYLGGCDATSNMLAGKHYGIPVVGTMAHSWVMAFDDERDAFQAYAEFNPNNVILLVDTYDTLTGVDHAITVGNMLRKKNIALKGVRLDSGDLLTLSQKAREKLNQAGFQNTRIYVSGDITEERMHTLKSHHAPIDGWGIGTHLSTCSLQPALDMVYKLGAIKKEGEWKYKLKRSDNRVKTSDPGILQVRRFYAEKKWLRDVIYLEEDKMHCSDEQSHDLLQPIFRNGQCVYAEPSLDTIRQFCLSEVQAFMQADPEHYSVTRDAHLMALKKQLMDNE